MVSSITKDKFAENMQQFVAGADVPVKIAVAVSGGGDSMALALLMNEWVKERGGELVALTVDHNLRPESSAEAIGVGKKFEALGIPHKILTWEGDKPDTHIQELAREARYNLLIEECKQQGYKFLAIAHNLEDQAETFWMRLAHGSGLDGLAAMSNMREIDGVKIIRPVMNCSRESLRLACSDRGIKWIEDPSNKNKKYLRVKLREFEEVLAKEGMTTERIVKSIKKLDDAKQALQEITSSFMNDCVKVYPVGYAALKISMWKNYPVDIQRRILSELLNIIYPQTYKLGFDKLELTRQALLQENFAGKTVHGCELMLKKSGDVLFLREESKAEPASLLTEDFIWDKRFLISGCTDESLSINVLGNDGVAQLKACNWKDDAFSELQFKVKRLFPSIWLDDQLLAIPHIGYYSASCDECLKKLKVNFVNVREGFYSEQRT